MFIKQTVAFWLIFFLCLRLGIAQEITLKHTVSSGETISEIAQIYKIAPEEIQKLNPSIINGIKENDVLIIPILKQVSLNTDPVFYTVKLGDTKFSLARQFGITIADLEKQNPQTVPMLKVGEVLQFGNNDREAYANHNDTFYLVKSGDTKFGLSKRFGVTIEQLEDWNPDIVPTLKVGQTLVFSEKNTPPLITGNITSAFTSEETNKAETDQTMNELTSVSGKEVKEENGLESRNISYSNSNLYLSHTIQPGETLYGLSKAAGMSIEAFTNLNPKLSTSVQAGMVIKMPTDNKAALNATPTVQTEYVKSTSKYINLKQTLSKEEARNITFILPFSLNEFSKYRLDKENLSENIRNNRDFFKGALIAIDSAKSLGLNFDFSIVDISSAKLSTELVTVAQNAKLDSTDLIILPFYKNDIQDLATSVAKSGTTLVTTSNLLSNLESPNLFEAVPSVRAQRQTMLDYLSSKNDGNLIVLNDENRLESRDFILANNPKAKFVRVNEKGVFNSEDLVKKLQKDSKNYVIIDTDKKGVFISATNDLLRELSNFKIQLVVLEASLIPDEDDVSRKRFVILDMLYPSINNIKSYDNHRAFIKLYKNRYSVEPVTMSTYGFDITFDALLRLFQQESFEKSSKKITEYNILKMKYLKNGWGYYSNFGVSIFQYESHDTHKQVY